MHVSGSTSDELTYQDLNYLILSDNSPIVIKNAEG